MTFKEFIKKLNESNISKIIPFYLVKHNYKNIKEEEKEKLIIKKLNKKHKKPYLKPSKNQVNWGEEGPQGKDTSWMGQGGGGGNFGQIGGHGT